MKPPADMTDAELNAAVAVECMGWHRRDVAGALSPWAWLIAAGQYRSGDWFPATDIAAAFEVVGEMRERGWRFDLLVWPDGVQVRAEFIDHRGPRGTSRVGRAYSDASPRAICEAALAAVRSEHAD